MARHKPKSAAGKAVEQIEGIKERAKALITGWKSRSVTQAAWHEAHEILTELAFVSMAEWEKAEIVLCEQYESWKQFTGATA